MNAVLIKYLFVLFLFLGKWTVKDQCNSLSLSYFMRKGPLVTCHRGGGDKFLILLIRVCGNVGKKKTRLPNHKYYI